MNRHRFALTRLAALACVFSFTACSNMSTQDKNTAVGAGAGAVLGSVLGGGAIGTVGGAVVGGVIGNQVKH